MFEDGRDIEACGFDMEVIPKTFQAPLSDDSPIEKRTRTAPGSTTTVDSNRPILNLICAVRSKWAAPAIFKIKHRLRPNSAVFALAEGFGVLEEIWAMNFPDPITRPSFRFCLAKHGVWERAPGLERGANMYKDTVEDLFQGEAVHSTGFDIHHDISRGKLRIGPLAVDRNTSEPERFRREHDMEYFTNQLLDYPRLNALKVDQGLLLFHRYKKLVQDAVMG